MQVTCPSVPGAQPFRCLLVPRHLGQFPDSLAAEVAKNNFQAEEALARVLAPKWAVSSTSGNAMTQDRMSSVPVISAPSR